ncbi:MAG TPA: hypothetical protein VHL31_03985 [Geminicoccus sp.]|jgi:hypothetical protein|uniref:hypothetical protein n=1 Tax=Geminicoccus sp. TaxID=2024832 RepID=UPI002E31DD79|nr:hypothetical protein [Geminicoccus sp.]HEX2525450.1 hypothetical protein [Geminicoccus sp.]
MAKDRQNPDQDPVEGAPDVIDNELERQGGQGSSQNQGRAQQMPTPDDTTKGDRIPEDREEVINSTNGLP